MAGEGTTLTLRPALWARLLAFAFLGLPLSLVLAGVTAKAGERSGFFLVATVCTPLFGALAWAGGMATWTLDDDGIERRTPLMRRVRMRWSEVVTVRAHWLGTLTFGRGQNGPPLQVSAGLAGIDALIRGVLRHCSASAMTDSTHRLLERRAGVAPPVTAVPVDAPEPVLQVRADSAARWKVNPFFALGLSPECSRAEVERAGQKLLALLAIGSASARRFRTPLGEMERTEDVVRTAMAELRDPEKRIAHEAWARFTLAEPALSSPARADDPARPWPNALSAIRWRRP